MYRTLVLRSVDRGDGPLLNSTRFRLQLSKPLRGTYAVSAGSVPNTRFNIDESNNTLIYTDTALRTVTIPVGYYRTSSLLMALVAGMNAASGVTYNWVQDPNSYLLTLSGPGPFTLQFKTYPGKYSIAGYHTASLAAILGFKYLDYSSSGTNSLVSPVPPNINWNTAYYFNFIADGSNTSAGTYALSDKRDFSLAVLVDVGSNEIINYRPMYPPHVKFAGPESLEVEVRDDTRQLVNLRGGEFTLILDKID